MDNILHVSFGARREMKTEPRWQGDYGQVLVFDDIELPMAYEVHFSNNPEDGEAIGQIGNAEGVTVPDQFFLDGRDVYAWIFLHEGEDDGETRYMVRIPVRPRPDRSDEVPTPVQQSEIDQAIAALNAAVDAAEDAQEAAETAQEAAETAQGKAEDAQEAAETAQEAAETAQGKAEDAQEAAETAQGKAKDAQEAAETAQGKAEAAQEAVEGVKEELETEFNQKVNKPNTNGTLGQVLATYGNGSTYWANQTGGGNSGDFVTPEEYGAIGDGVTDDTQAFVAAIASGENIKLTKAYKISAVSVSKSINLVGDPGAKIITPQHTSGFEFAPAIKNRLHLAENYSKNDNTADSGISKIKLTSLGSAKVGDLVDIYSNQNYVPARSYYVKGCAALITKIDTATNTIYINYAMPFDLLAADATVDVYTPVTVNVSGIEFFSTLDLTASTGTNAIRIAHGAFCNISNCRFSGFTTQILLSYSVMCNISDCTFENAKPSSSLSWDGYGIMIASCNVTTIDRVTANCGQHAISTGGTTPVYGTVIKNSRLFAECGEHAIGMHDNDHDCTIMDSLVGGIWCVGDAKITNVRFTQSADGGVVLITGNPGDRKTSVVFNNVTFDETMYITMSAYPQNPASSYSNDYGNVIFEECTGGYLRALSLESNEYITGSNIDLISVDHWRDCRGFVLSYGVINELSLNSLLFKLETEAGYITSQTERIINYPCVVLNEHNMENVYDTSHEVGTKATSVIKNTGVFSAKSLDDTGYGNVENFRVYGKLVDGEPITSPSISFVSGDLVPDLDGFTITVENGHLNGPNVVADRSRWLLVPEEWKRKKMRVSCTIDATNTAQDGNSVAVWLQDAKGNTIYSTYQNSGAAGTSYTSTCNFVVPDEAYRMIINARLYADAENASISASNFSLKLYSGFKANAPGPLYAIPVTTGGNYTDANDQQWYANYLDFYTGMMLRLVDIFRFDIVAENMFTSMLDYFDSGIVGGFISADIVQANPGLARDLSMYYSPSLTILETNTPPTNQESIWINDGGIGFAFSTSNVGARTMAALAAYVNTIHDKLYCKMNPVTYANLRQTDIAVCKEIKTYDGKTDVSTDNGAYIAFDYCVDTKTLLKEEPKYRLIKSISLSESTRRVYVNADGDGHSFSLNDVIIVFNLAAASGSSSGLIVVNTTDTQPGSSALSDMPCLAVATLFSTSAQACRVVRLHSDGGRFFGEAEYTNFGNYYTPLYTQVSRNASGKYECNAITSINIFSANDHSFGANTTMDIYGK